MNKINYNDYYLPAEWLKQSAIQLTWPHKNTDWARNLDLYNNIQYFFIKLAEIILNYQDLIIVANDITTQQNIENSLNNTYKYNYYIYLSSNNDTWTRDHGPITLLNKNNNKLILDFNFNAWGGKFDYDLDNKITNNLFNQKAYNNYYYKNLDYILEGGAIDSNCIETNNPNNIILTTSTCLLNNNRNNNLSDLDKINKLKQYLNIENLIILDNSKLIGDDTDGHIDILARFCDTNTILYTACDNKNNPNYNNLLNLKLELEQKINNINIKNNLNIKLIPLYIPDKNIYSKYTKPSSSTILGASYANFLIINNAVILPVYNNKIYDQKAVDTLKSVFKNREIITLDATAAIEQGGSLHCLTMQIPA